MQTTAAKITTSAATVRIMKGSFTDFLFIFVFLQLVPNLDDGLDTELGEKGLGLSEGQVQRIAIARALLYGAPILLLDESTSALDSKTEQALLTELKKMKDKTLITISHKKAAFDICNRVIDYKTLKGEVQ